MFFNLTHRIGVFIGIACATGFVFCGSSDLPAESAANFPAVTVDLALKQSQLADKYRRLETLMLKMAEYDASNNPRRAALLKQTLAKGKEFQIAPQLDELIRLFRQEQLQEAVDGQHAVQVDLRVLLKLLQSENRPDRLKNEQARVRSYIKQLDRIIRQQKSVHGRTEGGEKGGRLADDQGRVADRTQTLGEEMDQAEGTTRGPQAGQRGTKVFRRHGRISGKE